MIVPAHEPGGAFTRHKAVHAEHSRRAGLALLLRLQPCTVAEGTVGTRGGRVAPLRAEGTERAVEGDGGVPGAKRTRGTRLALERSR